MTTIIEEETALLHPSSEPIAWIPGCPQPRSIKELFSPGWIVSIYSDTSRDVRVLFGVTTLLEGSEVTIPGPEYQRRIKKHRSITLGWQHAFYCLHHHLKMPELRALPNGTSIDFPALRVLDSKKEQYFPCLEKLEDCCHIGWYGVNRPYHRNMRVAIDLNILQ